MNEELLKAKANCLLNLLKDNALKEKCKLISTSKDSLDVEYYSGDPGIFRGYYSPLKTFAICSGLQRPKIVQRKTKKFTGYCYYKDGDKIVISEQYQNGSMVSVEYLFEEKNGVIYSVQYDAEGDIIAVTQTEQYSNFEETIVLTIYTYEASTNFSEFTGEFERNIFKDGRLLEAVVTEFSKDDKHIEEDIVKFNYEGNRMIGYFYNGDDYYSLTPKTAGWV